MTPREKGNDWAEKMAYTRIYLNGDGVGMVHPKTVADYLRKEHARSRRIVKAEIKRVKMDEHNYRVSEQILLIMVLGKLLTKLQGGRGGKG